MCADPDTAAERSKRAVARIGEALGISASAFYEPGAGSEAPERAADMVETAVLALVQDHLRGLDPDGRARFVEAVRAMAAVGTPSTEPPEG